jgi:hypothetical protein
MKLAQTHMSRASKSTFKITFLKFTGIASPTAKYLTGAATLVATVCVGTNNCRAISRNAIVWVVFGAKFWSWRFVTKCMFRNTDERCSSKWATHPNENMLEWWDSEETLLRIKIKKPNNEAIYNTNRCKYLLDIMFFSVLFLICFCTWFVSVWTSQFMFWNQWSKQKQFWSSKLWNILSKHGGIHIHIILLLLIGFRCCQYSDVKLWGVNKVFFFLNNHNVTQMLIKCPITQRPMRFPYVANDGNTFELAAIKGWFARGHLTSPLTGRTLGSLTLVPNNAMEKIVKVLYTHRSTNIKIILWKLFFLLHFLKSAMWTSFWVLVGVWIWKKSWYRCIC